MDDDTKTNCYYCGCPHAQVLIYVGCPNPECQWFNASVRVTVLSDIVAMSEVGEWFLKRAEPGSLPS